MASRITNFCGLPVAVMGKLRHEADEARHLVVRDLALAERPDLFFGGAPAGLQHDPGADFLAEARVGHAEDLHRLHLRVAEQELLDLARIDVLAAADQHVLHAADDVAVALGVDRREVAAVHPAGRVDRLARALGLVPVAAHHQVAARAQLARHADRDDAAALIDDLDLDVRLDAAHGRHAALERVVDARLERHRAGFGHAVGDGDLVHVHVGDHPAHGLDRARRAGHDAGAQRRQVVCAEVRVIELGDEHRRHAVQRRAAVLLHRAQRLRRHRSPRPGTPSSNRWRCRPARRAPCRSSDTAAPGCTAGRARRAASPWRCSARC